MQKSILSSLISADITASFVNVSGAVQENTVAAVDLISLFSVQDVCVGSLVAVMLQLNYGRNRDQV